MVLSKKQLRYRRAREKTNAKILDLLGMPYGRASSRLKKMILYDLAKQCNRLSCYRCQSTIETVAEFSVDHKEPYLDVSPELFWDLSNIAFSHLTCNISAARKDTPDWKETRGKPYESLNGLAPKGMAWCSYHKEYLPKEDFHKNKRTKNGCTGICKDCSIRYSAKYREEHPEWVEKLNESKRKKRVP